MINKLELENLKQIYLKLSEDIDVINFKINNILYNINDLSFNLNSCMINNVSIDNGLVDKSKSDLELINKYLKDNVKIEILDLLTQINEQLNS